VAITANPSHGTLTQRGGAVAGVSAQSRLQGDGPLFVPLLRLQWIFVGVRDAELYGPGAIGGRHGVCTFR
jgi:hypothetical protein